MCFWQSEYSERGIRKLSDPPLESSQTSQPGLRARAWKRQFLKRPCKEPL